MASIAFRYLVMSICGSHQRIAVPPNLLRRRFLFHSRVIQKGKTQVRRYVSGYISYAPFNLRLS